MDFYKHRIGHAAWTWREAKVSRFHRSRGARKRMRKDRASGRNEKRGARQLERREIDGATPSDTERRWGHE